MGLLRAGLSIPQIFAVLAVMNAAVALFIYQTIPEFLFRFAAWVVANLMYRLRVVPIFLPPLRERRVDVEFLVRQFIAQHNVTGPRHVRHVGPAAMRALLDHQWPGNVRELKNLTERFVLVHPNKRVETSDLPDKIRGAIRQSALRTGSASFDDLVSSLERQLIFDAMEKTQGNKTQAAELLKMSPSKFRYKLSSYTGEN